MSTTIIFPTVKVTARVADQSGSPVSRAEVHMRLAATERYGAYIVPREVKAVTDANGQAILEVFPNELGSEGSEYQVRITFPDTTGIACAVHGSHLPPMRTISGYAVVPNANCNLQDIMELPAYGIRGTGQVITAEVAGYASAAASSTDASKSYMEAAKAVETRVNTAKGAAEAAKTAAQEAAVLSGGHADRAGGLVKGIESTVAGFQSDVVGQVQETANRLTSQSSTAITQAKAVALDAIEGNAGSALSEIATLGAQVKTDAITAVKDAGDRVAQSFNAAAEAALEEFKDMGALFGEDFENLTEQAQAAAKRSACSAAAAQLAAAKACECASKAEAVTSNLERAIAEAATNILTDEIKVEAVVLATQEAVKAASSAADAASAAKYSEKSAFEYAEKAGASARSAEASASDAATYAGKLRDEFNAHDALARLLTEILRLSDRVTKAELGLISNGYSDSGMQSEVTLLAERVTTLERTDIHSGAAG